MDRVVQKRVARHARSVQSRHDRLVSAYLKKKYPKEYKEASQYYDQLNEKYPDKRDLTKTDEFLFLSTGYTSFYQKYRAQQECQKKKTGDDNQINDTMALKIPLMEKSDVEIAVISQKIDDSLLIPEDIYNNLLASITKDPEMNAILNDIATYPEQQVPEQQQQQHQQQQIDELLDELDDILPEITEQTPLEKELS